MSHRQTLGLPLTSQLKAIDHVVGVGGVVSDAVTAAPISRTRSLRLLHAALIAVTPWLQLALNPNLFMTPQLSGYIDPWVYTGFFLSLPDFMTRFPDTYYGARLSWVLPGFLAHQAFSPLVANYVLHLAFFYALLTATYWFVSATTSWRSAMLVTTVVAWNPVILAAVGWDYVDGAGIVFIMGTLLALEKATQSPDARWAWSWLAGSLMACMACSNLFLVVMWPIFGLFLIRRVGTARLREVPPIGAAAMAGGALAFLLLAAANVSLGGSWLILKPQLRMSQVLLSAPNPWRLAGYAWVRHAPWLVLPAAATIGGFAALLKLPRAASGFARTLQVLVLVEAAVWVAVQLAGTPVLQISYYCSYLAPFALIALALAFGVPSPRLSPGAVVTLECVAFVLFAAIHWSVPSDAALFQSDSHLARAALLAALGTLALVVVAIHWVADERARWALFALCFSMIGLAVPRDLPSRSQGLAKAYYEEVVDAHRFIARHLDGRKSRTWISNPRAGGQPLIAAASTYLWMYSLLNDDLPRLGRAEASTLTSATRLVMLVPTTRDAETARAPLRQFGFDFDVIAAQTFGTGDMALAVVIADLR